MSAPASYALVNNATGKVVTFLRADLPDGYTPPDGCTLVAREELPEGWQHEQYLATPADIAAHRWKVENGGVTVTLGGTPHRFDTTRENRAMWLALRLEATANPILIQDWKTLDGVFVELSAADVLTVCSAVYAHVAASFAAEATLLANPPTLGDLPAAFEALMP